MTKSPKEVFTDNELDFFLDIAFEALGHRPFSVKGMMSKYNISADEDVADGYPNDELNARLADHLNEIDKK